MSRLVLGLLAALLLSACGGSTGLLLSMESSLGVPGDVDGLMVRVESLVEPAASERLQITEPFPHSLAVVVDAEVAEVVVEVTALKGNVAVTTSRVTVPLTPGVLRPYTISL